MSREKGERALGPYDYRGGFRIILVGPDGRRRPRQFESRQAAIKYRDKYNEAVVTTVRTTETAREAFVKALELQKRSPRTVDGYKWAIKTFWPTDIALRALTTGSCKARYGELTATLSVDSHRNALKMCRTFLEWCVEQDWLRVNPLAELEGTGKRKRGKPQLRISEARTFYTHCLKQSEAGDHGAVAALLCLLLTMRSQEALNLVARDIDDGGRVLWIDDSKTPSGRRMLEIPKVLRGPLTTMTDGKPADAHLFKRRDRKWLWDEVQRLCVECEIGEDKVSPHGLRGMHATIAKQAGVTSHQVAAALGHASTVVTERHYIDQDEVAKTDRSRTLDLLDPSDA